MRRRLSGFTLIETLAVVIALALVMTTVFATYGAVQRQATFAAEATEAPRRATALLDRMAREIAGTVLVVKPESTDPLDHPWVFLAESRQGSLGSDRVRFQTRSHRPRASEAHASDLLDVAWFLVASDDGASHELLRWSSPQLPERLERQFPRRDAAGVQVWARGIAELGVRWLSEDGDWVDEWDSSTVVRSSRVPVAAEITVAFLAADESLAPTPLTRRVNLPLRPVDLAVALGSADDAPGSGADTDAGDLGSFDDSETSPPSDREVENDPIGVL